MTYMVFEGNMDRLNKKLAKIEKKCNQYGCDFHYQVVGSEYRETEDGVVKFYEVEASGTAKINGWQLVAKIEHHDPVNMVMQVSDIKVPEKYWTTKGICEHCNTAKSRKNTFLVYNESTGEFKQVGKSCLQSFTNGLSAEMAVDYVSMFNELIKGEAVDGSHAEFYRSAIDTLRYAVAAVKAFGYSKTKLDDGSLNYDSTNCVVSYAIVDEKTYLRYRERGMDVDAEGVREEAEAILNWINDQPMDYGYISNLKVAVEGGYVNARHQAIVVSAVQAYHNAQERAAKAAKAEAERRQMVDEWIGQVGQRVDLEIAKCKIATSWYNEFGITYVYKLVTTDNHVCTWKTSKGIDIDQVRKIRATVKGHNEYKGCKETELTRCKVVE